MAIPTTGKQALATATNPSGVLTDPTLFIDLSLLNFEWWGDSNTSNGPNGRACKLDGTELACDWIYFDNTSQVGILAVKWSGTLAISGSQQVYVFPPNTRNTAYSTTDTYGQYNAYKSSWLVLSPNGGGDNRIDGTTATATGAPTIGGVTAPFGFATNFASGQYINTNVSGLATSAYLFTLDRSKYTFISGATIGLLNNNHICKARTSGYVGYTVGGVADYSSSIANSTNDWQFHSWNANSGANVVIRQDADTDTVTIGTHIYGANNVMIAHAAADQWEGDIGITGAIEGTVSAAFDALMHEMISDNAAFWGTWVTSDVSGGSIIPVLQSSYRRRRLS